MNVVFHTLIGGASAAILSKSSLKTDEGQPKISCLIAGAGINLLMHGIMDLIPHNYPFTMITDGIITLVVILAFILICDRKFRLLTLVCIVTAIIPDLIDKMLLRLIFQSHTNIFFWHNSNIINLLYSHYTHILEYSNYISIIMVFIVFILLILFRNPYIRKLAHK